MLKLDCEGHDGEVLAGAKESLRRREVRFLILEYRDPTEVTTPPNVIISVIKSYTNIHNGIRKKKTFTRDL